MLLSVWRRWATGFRIDAEIWTHASSPCCSEVHFWGQMVSNQIEAFLFNVEICIGWSFLIDPRNANSCRVSATLLLLFLQSYANQLSLLCLSGSGWRPILVSWAEYWPLVNYHILPFSSTLSLSFSLSLSLSRTYIFFVLCLASLISIACLFHFECLFLYLLLFPLYFEADNDDDDDDGSTVKVIFLLLSHSFLLFAHSPLYFWFLSV